MKRKIDLILFFLSFKQDSLYYVFFWCGVATIDIIYMQVFNILPGAGDIVVGSGGTKIVENPIRKLKI